MARRRKNPLLGRILLVSVAVHIVALPVLAYFGAFKKIQASMTHAVVEVVPAPAPPEKEPPKEEKEAKEPEDKKAPTPGEAKAQSNLNQPKVAAASGAAGPGESAGPTVNPQGSGQAGQVPTATKSDGGSGSEQPAASKPVQPPVVAPEAKPQPKQPAVEKPEAKPEPVKPRVPVLASAEPLSQPLPEVPDDLRADALDKTVVVLVVVSPEGKPRDLTVTGSSGVSELDDLAVRAVRRWTFRPATKDGEPVSGKVRVHVRFKVEG